MMGLQATKARLMELEARLASGTEAQEHQRRMDALQRELARARQLAERNHDRWDAAQSALSKAQAYEGELLVAFRALREEFKEETGGRRPRTARPLSGEDDEETVDEAEEEMLDA